VSAAGREYLEGWQRELDRDPEYQDWLKIIEAKNRKEEKDHVNDGKSKR
jgi:hypothetical protein